MNNSFIISVVFSYTLAMAPGGYAESEPEVYLSTERTESKLIEVAVPEFPFSGRDTENLGFQASRIINYDLKFARYFKPNENYTFMRQASKRDMKAGKINFDEWRTLTSNFLVKGNLSRTEENKLSVEIRVYDIQARKLFFAKRYIGSRSLFRQIIHQFSDDFLKRMTGETGLARTKIAIISRVNGHKELLIMDYDGYNPRPVTSDRSIVLQPNWNQKRKNMILFTTYRYRNPDLYAFDLKARTRYPISRRVGLNSTGEWSPDGTKVAFSLSRRGNSDIYICNADGTGLTKLTYGRSIETNPTWSPDSQHIAYTSDRSGSPQIYVMKVDGGGKRRITYKGSYNDGASWSSRNNLIAYTSLIGRRFDIALVNYPDRAVTRLTFGKGSNESPAWAPDGRKLAFSSTRGGVRQIFTTDIHGSDIRQVTFLSGGGYSPTWGPN